MATVVRYEARKWNSGHAVFDLETGEVVSAYRTSSSAIRNALRMNAEDKTRCSSTAPSPSSAPSVATEGLAACQPLSAITMERIWRLASDLDPINPEHTEQRLLGLVTDAVVTEIELRLRAAQAVPPTGLVSPGDTPNTDAPRQNTAEKLREIYEQNYFQQIHDSDKGWAERNVGQRERE